MATRLLALATLLATVPVAHTSTCGYEYCSPKGIVNQDVVRYCKEQAQASAEITVVKRDCNWFGWKPYTIYCCCKWYTAASQCNVCAEGYVEKNIFGKYCEGKCECVC